MTLLILGLILFLGVHSVRMAAPGLRASFVGGANNAYRGVHAAVSAVGLVLIVWGFARAAADPHVLYVPLYPLRIVTQVVMAPALVLAVASVLPTGEIKQAVRHPLLIATALWSSGHLLANGDLGGVVLFGALLAWSLTDLATVWNRAPKPVAGPGSYRSDIAAVIGGLVLYGLLVGGLHLWLFGHAPM